MVYGVVGLAKIKINLIEGHLVDGGKFLLEFEFNNGGAGASVAAETVGAVVKINLGLHPGVYDGFAYFPCGF